MAIKEEVYFEGKPHIGDLIANSLIGLTIVGLPLFVGALVRQLWVRYRITNRRVTIMGGWQGRDRSDIIYKEIKKLVNLPRGLGGRGDIVLTLKDGSRLEMRSVPNFREVSDYILERVDASARQKSGAAGEVAASR
ncbi:MAG: PH domain-containing protein [Cyanobacteria bacterium P01_A01_bin.3]